MHKSGRVGYLFWRCLRNSVCLGNIAFGTSGSPASHRESCGGGTYMSVANLRDEVHLFIQCLVFTALVFHNVLAASVCICCMFFIVHRSWFQNDFIVHRMMRRWQGTFCCVSFDGQARFSGQEVNPGDPNLCYVRDC